MAKATIVQKVNSFFNSVSKIKNPIKWVVALYICFVGLALVSWLFIWLLSAFFKVPDLTVGLKFIDQLTSMTSIGFVCFIAGCFVDLNNNGIPDGIECKIDIKKPLDNLLGLKQTNSHPDNG